MRLTLALPGDPLTLTGGYIYDRRLAAALERRGIPVDVLRLDTSFPFPTPAALEHARAALAGLPDGSPVLVDGLALGAMPAVVAGERRRLRIAGLVHHPLAMESGLDAAAALALARSEGEALAAVSSVIVTSHATAAIVHQRFGVPRARITVAEPGTDPAPPARGSGGPHLALLSVGTLTPRKGHDLLLDALAPLRDRDWQLVCVGSDARDPGHARRLRDTVTRHGLGHRVHFTGELDEAAVRRHYDDADAFVLPTHLEGYGMALAEAVARGLPVVTTAGGAAADTVGAQAALLVPAADSAALRAALERLLDEPDLRRRLATAARARAATLPTWDDTATAVEPVLRRLAGS